MSGSDCLGSLPTRARLRQFGGHGWAMPEPAAVGVTDPRLVPGQETWRGGNQTRRLRRRSEFKTTEIDDAVIAKAAKIGLMRMPKKG